MSPEALAARTHTLTHLPWLLRPTFNHQARDAVSWSEAQAVDSIMYDMLETALEVNAEWHSDVDGGWSVAEPTQSAAGAAGARDATISIN